MKDFMRKLMIGILITAIVLGSVVSIWLHFYYQQKSPDNLPNLQTMKDYLTEKGEVFASEKIVGYDRDTFAMVWGDPVGELFGMDGSVWKVDDTCSVTIYFDGETATNAKLVLYNEEETNLTMEALDAIVPALQVDGEIYYLAGESYFGERCGMMDGEITSTVERWEMPTEDNQSNFGEYGYQYGNEGFIEVLQDGKWYSYGTRSDKGRVLFNDWWFDLAYISEETLVWLEWYLEQPEEIKEQAYVPADLRDPYHLSGTAQLELDARKQAVHDALYQQEYYQMEDGKWKYRGYIYDQMIEMVGRTPNAVRDAHL